MDSGKIWQGIKRAYLRYDQMMQRQGFYVVLVICVIVIVGSAVYTFRLRDEAVETPPSAQEALVAGGSQDAQTLAEAQALIASQNAAEALVTPTAPPFQFVQPVSGFTDRTFSDSEPQFFAQGNVWRVHAGIDLLADYGAPVTACAGGTVQSVGQDNELGLCVMIDHGNGYQTLYAGLSSADYTRAGDPVRQGQTIGHIGNGVLCESDAPPHLHLEIHHNGKPVDPLAAFLGLDN